jgi:predicted permease
MQPDVIGRSIRLDEETFTVIGVAQRGFRGIEAERRADVWIPLGCYDRTWLTSRSADWLRLLARRLPRRSDETVQSALQSMFREDVLDRAHKDSPWRRELLRLSVAVEPAAGGLSYLKEQFAAPLRILLILTGVLLLIACANVAGLLLARGSARRREIALRLSIGATRARILQQWLTESFLLAAAGGALGLFLAVWSARLLIAFLPSTDFMLPPDINLDATVLLFATAAVTVAALAFGGLSAWRSLAFDAAPALKDGGAGSKSRLASRRVLIVAQVALSFVLLVGAGLFVHTLAGLRWTDPGFRPDGVLTFWLDVPKSYKAEQTIALQTRLLERLGTIPGVTAASTASMGPFQAGRSTTSMVIFTPEGRQTAYIDDQVVSEQYFESLGATPVKGRLPTHADTASPVRVAVINQSFAAEYFRGRDPIGGRIGLDPSKLDGGPPVEIVGVVPDLRHYGLREQTTPFVYLLDDNKTLSPWRSFIVRSQLPPQTIIAVIRRTARDVDPNAAITDARTLDDRVNESLMQERLLATLSSVFGFLAVSLAAVGLYGLMSYVVVQRTSEIGVRIALGATRGNVIRLILRDATLLVIAGLAVGIPAALMTARLASAFLYGVKPHDAWTLVAAASLMIFAGSVAALLPSRRAAATNPITALRYE